jgi:murein tripeptide amidase MpaA
VEIDQSISSLKDNCLADIKEFNLEQMFPKLDKKIKNKISLVKYYDISSKNKNNDKKTKENIFILGGEHPRELIASELVYNLIYFLCKPEPNDLNTVNDLLKNFNFRIIVNANPSGRKIVEEGEYCRRTNYNNVDINRNWDIFWGETTNSSEENPGSSAFSEIETKFILNSIKDYNAKLFLTIHSGIFGLYLPYAYLEKEGK